MVKGKVDPDVLKKILADAAGVPFYNRSKFSFSELLKDAANIKENFGSYLGRSSLTSLAARRRGWPRFTRRWRGRICSWAAAGLVDTPLR